jgi:soluble lytic murein transglycosylase-like protein
MLRVIVVLRTTLAFALCIGCVAPCSAGEKAGSTTTYAAALRAINPQLAFAQSVALAQTLLADARRLRLDPRLVMALVKVESTWNPHAVSYDGATGLGQLEPATARHFGVTHPTSGRENLHATMTYLHELMGSFHRSPDPIKAALSGYNGGPLYVKLNGGRPTPGTSGYVAKVLTNYHELRNRVPAPALVAEISPRTLDAIAADVARNVERSQETYWGAR